MLTPEWRSGNCGEGTITRNGSPSTIRYGTVSAVQPVGHRAGVARHDHLDHQPDNDASDQKAADEQIAQKRHRFDGRRQAGGYQQRQRIDGVLTGRIQRANHIGAEMSGITLGFAPDITQSLLILFPVRGPHLVLDDEGDDVVGIDGHVRAYAGCLFLRYVEVGDRAFGHFRGKEQRF